MATTVIQRLNRHMPKVLNINEAEYKKLFGAETFSSNLPIEESADVNCGAIANELSFLKQQVNEVIDSFSLDGAEADLLEVLIQLFVDFQRSTDEIDADLRTRAKAYLVRNSNLRWHTTWAYIDAFSYFFPTQEIIVEENYVETNLLTNGGFTSDLSSWNETETGSSVIDVATDPFTGYYSAEFSIDSSNSSASLDQTVSGVTAGNYKIALWHKDDGNCPTSVPFKISIQRSGDSYYYNFTDRTWQSGATYLEATKTSTWTYLYGGVVVDGTYDLTIKIENDGGSGTAYAFYVDKIDFGVWQDYPSFRVIIILDSDISGGTLFLSNDSVVDWSYANLYLDQGYFGGTGGGLGIDFYTRFLDKMRSAGIKGTVQIVGRILP